MERCCGCKELEQALSILYQQLIGRQSATTRRSSYSHINSRRQLLSRSLPQVESQPQSEVIAVDGHNVHQVMKELEKAVIRVLDERDQLAGDREQLQQVVEAARRERVMAIEERDKIVHRHHILKISLERNEATLKLVEGEKSRLVTRCEVLEQELVSLRQSLHSAEKAKLSLADEQAKANEERKRLRGELCCLQQDKDTVMASRSQLEADLRRSVNIKLQQRTELERIQGCYQYMESQAHSLQQQNEVLCAKSCQIVHVVMQRSTGPWGFSIEGGRGSEYFAGDPSIVVTGIAPNTPAMSSLRYGDRLMSVEDQAVYGLAKTEAIELLSSLATKSKLRVCLNRVCSPHQPHKLTVQLPDRWSFDYKAHYSVCRSDCDVLCVGDHIVKVMGKTVDGLRSSQMRKLLKNCTSGVAMEVERVSSHHLPHSTTAAPLHEDDSLISPSLHSNSPLPSNRILTPTTNDIPSMTTANALPTNSHRQTDV